VTARLGFSGLVAHDLKLGAREFLAIFGAMPRRRIAVVLAVIFVGLHAFAWPVALWLGARENGPEGANFLALAMRIGVGFVLPWAIASPMTSIARQLHQRGDWDLLFASPVAARDALAARLVAQAIEAVASVSLLLLPLANASVLQGRVHWLAVYPALAAAGLFGAGFGLALAIALFFAVGPRRARVVSQIGATLVGASAVLGAQLVAMLPEETRARLIAELDAPGGGDGWRGLLTLPARAAAGDPGALVGWIALALAIFVAVVWICGEPFSRAALQSAGAPSALGRARVGTKFRAELGPTLRLKEHRLLWRDPWLLSQMMLQVLYTVPIGVMLWRNGGPTGAAGIAFGPTLAVIAGQLTGSLAWIALSAEDAPDFLATAPAMRGDVERGKLAAVAVPVAMVMTPPLMALAWAAPWGAFCALFGGLGAGVSAGLLMLWRQAPARRGMVLRRHSQSKLVALAEHWLSMLWAMATGIAAFGSWAFVAPIALAALTLWAVRPRREPTKLTLNANFGSSAAKAG
jgi:ABC-2 type transport system permease protein